MGEKAPFKDSSEIKAKCTDCIDKEKEDAAQFKSESSLKDGKVIKLDCGLEGRLWVAKTEDEKISFWELAVSGKKFHCSDNSREQFQKYLESIPDQQCEITFLHSSSCKLDSQQRARKKKEVHIMAEEKKNETIDYNCTVKSNKQFAQVMYDGMAKRLNGVIKILVEASLKSIDKMNQKGVQE